MAQFHKAVRRVREEACRAARPAAVAVAVAVAAAAEEEEKEDAEVWENAHLRQPPA